MNKIFLTTDEWKKARDVSNQLNSLLREMGRITLKINSLEEELNVLTQQYKSVNENNLAFYDELIEKYGIGEIDTEQGVFIKKAE